MKKNRTIVLKWMGVSEGGYVNDPRDPGGETNRGVTKAVYDVWARGRNHPGLKHLAKDEANSIFYEQYMRPIRFDDLPSGLDYAVADYSVNSGPSQAAKELQRTINHVVKPTPRLTVDGIIGMLTLSNVSSLWGETLQLAIVDLCERRIRFMKRIRHRRTGARLWDTFGKGWKRRVMGDEDGVQDFDTGVIDRACKMARGQPGNLMNPVVTTNPGKATGHRTWLQRLLWPNQ